MQEAPDQSALAIINVTAGQEAQQIFFLVLRDIGYNGLRHF
jgi:hypothetical protein